jgi:hypothetical protein
MFQVWDVELRETCKKKTGRIVSPPPKERVPEKQSSLFFQHGNATNNGQVRNFLLETPVPRIMDLLKKCRFLERRSLSFTEERKRPAFFSNGSFRFRRSLLDMLARPC